MTVATSTEIAPFDEHIDKRVIVGMSIVGTAIAVAAIIGVVLVILWANDQRERDLRVWQERMGIIAASRAEAVAGWVAAQQSTIGSLAGNDTVRVYAGELLQPGGGDRRSLPAEGQYLENLLAVIAARDGFAAPPQGPDVPANVPRIAAAGIALLDVDGTPILATPATPAPPDDFRATVRGGLSADNVVVSRLFAGAVGGAPTLAFAAPILAIQEQRMIGSIIGIKPVAASLYPLLKQPGTTDASAAAVLVARSGATVQYLSPLDDGSDPLTHTLSLDTPHLAAAFALSDTGAFAVRRDYRDVEVLVTSRAVAGTDWVLMYKIDRDEALAESDARLARTLGFLLFIVAIVTVGTLAIWRHATSQRAARAASLFRNLAERFEAQATFIRRLTDSQPNAIFIVDANGGVAFANATLAGDVGSDASEELTGKSLAEVFGPHDARRHQRAIEDVLDAHAQQKHIDRRTVDTSERVVQTQYIPLANNHFAENSVLVVEEDLTDAITAREHSERVLQQIVDTLVSVVDRRDPYAADQSARSVEVALTIAQEMELDAVLIDTVEKAARLMNLGKIFVPVETLTKADRLDDAEIEHVHKSLDDGIDLLAGIEFDGPVVETLRQARAFATGVTAPQAGAEASLVAARIIAVANTFVAMTSARSHRAGMPVDQVVGELMARAGAAFDRSVVIALANIIENRGGRERWRNDTPAPEA